MPTGLLLDGYFGDYCLKCLHSLTHTTVPVTCSQLAAKELPTQLGFRAVHHKLCNQQHAPHRAFSWCTVRLLHTDSGSSYPGMMLSHLGPGRILSHQGLGGMLSHNGPGRILSHHGPGRILSHHGPGMMLNHHGPGGMLSHQGPGRMLSHQGPGRISIGSIRQITTLRVVARLQSLLRLRYLILTGAVGGGVAINQKVEQLRDYLPDVSWYADLLPSPTSMFSTLRDKLQKVARHVRSSVLPEGWLRRHTEGFSSWLDVTASGWRNYLTSAALRAETDFNITLPSKDDVSVGQEGVQAVSSSLTQKSEVESLREQNRALQGDYKAIYRELKQMEAAVRELRRQLAQAKNQTSTTAGKRNRTMKKSLIEMYSDVLEEMNTMDHWTVDDGKPRLSKDNLPRVVVIGDQSSGKTSVLEMIAQARIFPRGSGEMMTRSPVMVTLSEGPYHVASFRDSHRQFDLDKETDLVALRQEVERRMNSGVQDGQTVSSECISMSVKGPGIRRMVLVDLPGIISTVTTVMAPDTKDSIRDMCEAYMANPNAIILCIQDGSLDAERSNVTELVSTVDPQGKRTIFVLTKVDMAEDQLFSSERIRQILDGQLFPMKALGYYAVVTGRGNVDDTIGSIQAYEDQFFSKSRLFRDGILPQSQMKTQNLSIAVSDIFWKMVQASVEQQADDFKARKFNLQREWKNTFPRYRELDKVELFERARNDVLDEVVTLSQISPSEWEKLFYQKVWERSSLYLMDNIFLPAAQTGDVGAFSTFIDIGLKKWVEDQLPKECVQVAWSTMHDEFSRLLLLLPKKKDEFMEDGSDDIFDKLKLYVLESCRASHRWGSKAEHSLRVIQRNILEDNAVTDRCQWDSAVSFMECAMKEKLQQVKQKLSGLTGPTTWERWGHWKSSTDDHRNRAAVYNELDKIFTADPEHKQHLMQEELMMIRGNLERQGHLVENVYIQETWDIVFQRNFFLQCLEQARLCRKGFFHYQHGFRDTTTTGLNCYDIVLFWRIQRMLLATSNALRQQVVNDEARNLETVVRGVLDDMGENGDLLNKLLTGRRVQLAEELKKVRQVQEKLEEFINALNCGD